ncbi:MAG: hypothetical protein JWN43_2258, partial [Gammaproteobacteria bacterium]|nr:hypothetical protein [Gammaproteobacteria bacterium]
MMEVKKSNYSDTDKQLERFVTSIESKRVEANTNGIWRTFPTRMLGVIAALENNPSQRLAEMIRMKQTVALFDRRDGRKDCRRAREFPLRGPVAALECHLYIRPLPETPIVDGIIDTRFISNLLLRGILCFRTVFNECGSSINDRSTPSRAGRRVVSGQGIRAPGERS